jgi:predicted GNAT family N-acyltransferase
LGRKGAHERSDWRLEIDVVSSDVDDDDDDKTEHILEHKDLVVEIQRMWNVKTKVMPVKIGRN